MTTKQTQLFDPPVYSSGLSDPIIKWLFSLQYLLPLRLVDTSAGPYSEALPPAGVNSSTGQSAQNQEIVFVKTSNDANTFTLTGAAGGPYTLASQYDTLRFKSNGTTWYNTDKDASSGGGGSGGGVGKGGNLHNIHGYFPNRSTAPNVASGFQWSDADGATETRTAPTATEPILDSISTFGFGGGDDGYLADSGTPSQDSTLGVLLSSGGRILAPTAASSRYWIGLAAGGTALYPTNLNKDAPTIAFVGFRASTNAGDANWKCVCTTGAAQTTVDSGVAIDRANSHIFQVFPTLAGTAITFYIDGNLVATIATNLPAANVPLNPVAFMDNIGTAAVVTLKVGFFYYETI